MNLMWIRKRKTILLVVDLFYVSKVDAERAIGWMGRRGIDSVVIFCDGGSEPVKVWDIDKLPEGEVEEIKRMILEMNERHEPNKADTTEAVEASPGTTERP